ncbi:MAG: hypothetical protein AAF573_17770 [Bacteroidota bacterium]
MSKEEILDQPIVDEYKNPWEVGIYYTLGLMIFIFIIRRMNTFPLEDYRFLLLARNIVVFLFIVSFLFSFAKNSNYPTTSYRTLLLRGSLVIFLGLSLGDLLDYVYVYREDYSFSFWFKSVKFYGNVALGSLIWNIVLMPGIYRWLKYEKRRLFTISTLLFLGIIIFGTYYF